MIKKRRVFLAMFLALAVMLQYSFMPQTFMSYAEESSEGNKTETSEPAPEPKADPAPAPKADPAPAPKADPAPAPKADPAPAKSSSSSSSASSSTSSSSSSPSSSSSSATPSSSNASSDSGAGSSDSGSADNGSAPSTDNSAAPTTDNGEASAADSNSAASADSNSAASADSNNTPADKPSDKGDSKPVSNEGSADATPATTTDEVKSQQTKQQSNATEAKAGSPILVNAATNAKADPAPAADELTLHITNILYTKGRSENGHAVAYEDTFVLVKGQTKLSTGFINKAGGKNTTAGGLGYTYKFLNEFVLTDKDGAPVYQDSTTGLLTVKKVNYKGDGTAVVTFSDNSTQTISGNDVYISPVYKATANWYLNYKYIDNISTGGGSWSNKDAVVEFKHTFTNPEDKSPSLTEGEYSFRYWQNDETKEKYLDVTDPDSPSESVYGSAELKQGETKNVNVYAFWQPALSVIYNVLGEVADTVKNTDGIDVKVYDKTAESTVDNVTFTGWYDADGNRLDEELVYKAPEITKDANSTLTYNVFAKYATSRSVKKVWDDADNVDGIRSGSVTVQLYANGEPTGKMITLNDENSWEAVFADLDAYDADNKLIEYTINEEAIPSGYSAKIDVDGIAYTITNTHVPTPAPAPGGGGTNPDPTDDPTPGPGTDPSGTDPSGTDSSDDPTSTGGSGTTGSNGGGNGGGTTILTGAAGTVNPGNPGATGINKPATTVIDEPEPPLAINAYWAFINLLCAIATALLSLIMLVRYFGKRHEEDEETGEETEIKRKGGVRLASIIPAVAAIIAFILTEDMTNPMIMVDKWTLLMVVILAAQIVVAIIAKTKKHDDQAETVETAEATA